MPSGSDNLQYPKNKYFWLWVIIAIVLISIIAVVILWETQDKTENDDGEPLIDIDDRISPGIKQGLFVQIDRIRRRGLEEQMRTYGRKIPKPNPYYLVITTDGTIFNSSILSTAQGSGSGLLTIWDTGYDFIQVSEDITEEQPESFISLQIIEIQPKRGIFGKETHVELEKIDLTYDYRTGRWSGDDTLDDTDGYGHYLGENCEVWFTLTQTDPDGDNIPYWTEVNILHTDPLVDDSQLDPDQDGIPTAWEWKWEYEPYIPNDHAILDPDRDGLPNSIEYRLREWLANPFYQDIYVEVDGMKSSGKRYDYPTYILWNESQQMVIEKFSQHAITLHIDDGRMGEGGDIVPYAETTVPQTGMYEYYHNSFSDDRKGIFHYCLISHRAGWIYPQDAGNTYDAFSVSGSRDVFWTDYGLNNIFYSLLNPDLSFFNPRTKYVWLASIFMHELGHSIGLMPGYCQELVPDELKENDTIYYFYGNDNQSIKFREGDTLQEQWKNHGEAITYWANYVSCMNYGNQGGLILHGLLKPTYSASVLDFSDGTHGAHDGDDWGNIDLTFFKKTVPFIEGA